MVGVDDGVADRESHVTSTPSARNKGSTHFQVAAPTFGTYPQVSTLIEVLTKPQDGATGSFGISLDLLAMLP
jgi:hypothetical protein